MLLTLGQLKEFLIQRGPLPLMDVAHHFHKEPVIIRDMLAHWIRKGKVRITAVQTGCQTHCSGCGTGPVEMCAWVD